MKCFILGIFAFISAALNGASTWADSNTPPCTMPVDDSTISIRIFDKLAHDEKLLSILGHHGRLTGIYEKTFGSEYILTLGGFLILENQKYQNCRINAKIKIIWPPCTIENEGKFEIIATFGLPECA